jgi:hypothetical protein
MTSRNNKILLLYAGILLFGIIIVIFIFYNRPIKNMNSITSHSAESLIKSKGGKIDSSLSEKYGLQIYLLQDHSIITVEHGMFAEFKDVNELDSVLSNYKSEEHILYNKNPFNADFPDHTRELIDSVLVYLDMPHENVRLDRALIYSVNEQFVARQISEELKERFLLNIIALVGEVIIHERKAKWDMVLSEDDHVTWSPNLNYEGHRIALPVYVFENLFVHTDLKDPIEFSYTTINDIIDVSIEKNFIRK